MSSLFISHSSRDNEAAERLRAELEKHGHRSLFLDLDPEKGIQAGVSWERTLYTKLRACRAVVALCSEAYLASHWCFAEVALARMEGKDLFVLQIDPWSESTQMPSILTEDQFIDLRTDQNDGYRRLLNGFKVKGIVPAEAREWRPDEPPYPGLRAFQKEDAPIFFGREEEIRKGVELLNRIRRQGHPRLAMVLGSSGSGKSSLARAGIVPRLEADKGQWLVVGPFRPGRHPHRILAAALRRAFETSVPSSEIERRLRPSFGEMSQRTTSEAVVEPGEVTQEQARRKLREALKVLRDELTGGDERLEGSVRLLEEFLAEPPLEPAAEPIEGERDRRDATRRETAQEGSALVRVVRRLQLDNDRAEVDVVLVVDQFEELLGHQDEVPEHPANRFLATLRAGLEAEDCPFLVLATMRSDYLGELQKSEPLQGLGFRSLSLGPMSKAGMRDVIEQPAALGQIELETGLTERLLDETGTSDALPLLAFTLRALWDGFHEHRSLTLRDYEAFGGLQGAIAQVADEALEAALELGSEGDLRNAFLKLARPASEGTGWTRRSAKWEEFDEATRPMLRQFVNQRLLVTGKDEDTLEVAHEALFRSWAKLRGWLNVNAESLHLLREIEADAAKWDEAESEDAKEPYLWRGGRLARALELMSAGVLTTRDLDRDFIGASEAAEQARLAAEEERRRLELKRARRNAAILAGLLLLVVAAGFKAWTEKRKAVAWIESDLQSREVDKLLPVIEELIDDLGRSPGDVVGNLPEALFTAEKHHDFVRLVGALDGGFASGENDWAKAAWAPEVRCEVVARLRRDRYDRNRNANQPDGAGVLLPAGCDGLWPAQAEADSIELTGGDFLMGSARDDEWGQDNETPQRRVTVAAFLMQRREVTNEDYLRFDPGHSPADSPDPATHAQLPVVGVTWSDAMAYAIWSGGLLPSEAQWEFAARGAEGRRFPWGDDEADVARPVNDGDYELLTAEETNLPSLCQELSGGPLPSWCSPGDLTPEGIHGLGGNVREWCRDRYDYYPGHDLSGSETGERFVIRGGSFYDTTDELRGAFRVGNDSDAGLPILGFRVAWPAASLEP